MADLPASFPLPASSSSDLSGLSNEVASELGIAPSAQVVAPEAALFSSGEPQFETVGNTVYQKAGVDPHGQAVWKGPEGSELTSEELAGKKADFEKYGGLGGETAAALTGAARGVSFGLSDVALRGMGIDAETLRKIKEINPNISTTAELGSILATLIPTAGTSAAGGALEAAGTLTRAARGAGELATKLTASGLESSAAKTVAQKILSNAVSHGVGSAAEGAFYGAGQVVSDAALGDPEALGEKAIATVGLSAVFGGTLGAGFSALREVGPSLVGKTAETGEKLSGTLQDLRTKVETKIAEGVAGIGHQPKEVVTEAFTNPKFREAIIKPQLEIEADKAALIHDVQNYSNSIENQSKEYFSKVRPAEIASAFETEAIDPSFVQKQSETFQTKLQSSLDELKSKPKQFTEHGSIEQAQEKLDDLKAKFEKSSSVADRFQAIQEFKQEMDPILDWGSGLERDELSPGDRRTLEALRGIRGVAKDFLTNTENFGPAAASLEQSNRIASQLFEAQDDIRRMLLRPKTVSGRTQWNVDERKIDRFLKDSDMIRNRGRLQALQNYLDAGENLSNHIRTTAGGPYSVADLIDSSPTLPTELQKSQDLQKGIGEKLYEFRAQSQFKHLKPQGSEGAIAKYMIHPSDVIKAYAQMERVFGKVTTNLKSSIGEFLEKSASTVSKASVPLSTKIFSEVKFPVGEMALQSKNESNGKKEAAYHQRLNELSQIVGNPELSATHIAKTTDSMTKIAPNIGQAMQMKSLGLANYLYQTAPKDPLAGQRLLPTKHEYQPSDRELSKWARRMTVAENPMSILHDLKSGTLTHEQVETLKVGFPKLYDEMTSLVLEKMTETTKDVPYAKKLQLSILFGIAVDPALDRSFIQAMQQNHQGNEMRTGNPAALPGAAPVTATGMSHLKLSDSRQTTMERLQTR